jgi:hypothetical protein
MRRHTKNLVNKARGPLNLAGARAILGFLIRKNNLVILSFACLHYTNVSSLVIRFQGCTDDEGGRCRA